MTDFYSWYARLFNLAARALAVFSILCGVALVIGSLIARYDGWLIGVCAGLFCVAVGIAIFFAKPPTGEQLRSIGQRGTLR